MAKEIRGVSGTGTLYARVLAKAGTWWTGALFEAYSAAHYSQYALAMTEEGNSGVYFADFPAAITAFGTYEYYVYRQLGASPAEGDPIVGTGTVDWNGSASVSSFDGSLSATDWLSYLQTMGFIRDDKNDELLACTTDAIQQLRRMFEFDEAQVEAASTDSITVLGDYKIDVESNLGLLLGVVLLDDNTGTPLNLISKKVFDERYPGITVDNNKGYPRDFTVWGGQILIGPCPDRITYQYRLSYSQKAGTISVSTASIPFTALYREPLKDLTLSKIYYSLENDDQGQKYMGLFNLGLPDVLRRERKNSGRTIFFQKPFMI